MNPKNIKLIIIIIFAIILFILVGGIWNIINTKNVTLQPEISSEKQTIKIMTYNIFHDKDKSIDYHRSKIASIARYMNDNNISIAGIQEVSTATDPDVSVILKEEFIKIGFLSENIIVAPKISENNVVNVIVSKYPVSNIRSYPQEPCDKNGNCDRTLQVVDINTSIGSMSLVHTHVYRGCSYYRNFSQSVASFLPNPNVVVIGDFNIQFESADCDRKPSDIFSLVCSDSARCVQDKLVDYVFLPKSGSNFLQVSRILGTDLKLSDHYPVIAEIQSVLSSPIKPANEVTSPTPVPQIKVLTFNTNNTNDPKLRYDKLLILANYLKEHNIEIVGLQERDYQSDTDNDKLVLDKALQAAGYPMYTVQVEEIKHEANIIASKYPFVEGSYAEYNVNGGRNRVIQRIAVATPYGKLWVYNTHTNVARACAENLLIFGEILKPGGSFSFPPNEDMILMGDFNDHLVSDGEVGGCEYPDGVTHMNKALQNFRASCLDMTRCTNISPKQNKKKYIDLIITTKTSPTQIRATIHDNQIQDAVSNDPVGGNHPPVIGLIESPSFKFPTPSEIIPASTPTVSLTPQISVTPILTQPATPIPSLATTYPIDLDENGSISIEDFLKFVEYYKGSNCLIDFNNNSKCKDIEDFQIFVAEYKKSRV